MTTTQIATYKHINSVVTWAVANSVPSDYSPNKLGSLIWEANYKKAEAEFPELPFEYSELLAKDLTAIDVIKACDFLEENCEGKILKEIGKIKLLAISMMPANLQALGIEYIRERPEYRQTDWCIQ